MRQNVTWRHTTRSSRIRHRELTSRRDQRKAQVGRGGASNQPICFACGSQGHRAARCPFRQPPRDGNFKRQEYPGKKSTPSPQHKAASIVMPAEETSERKHCSLEQIEEFRRDGQIPVGNGSFLPLSSLVLPDKEEANVPVCEGRVGDTPVRVLRDTGWQQYCGQRGSRPGGRQVERICHSDSCRWHGGEFFREPWWMFTHHICADG